MKGYNIKEKFEEKTNDELVFEIGKTYVHSQGCMMRIVGRVDTLMYKNCLVAEDNEGRLQPVGTDPDNAQNWKEVNVPDEHFFLIDVKKSFYSDTKEEKNERV